MSECIMMNNIHKFYDRKEGKKKIKIHALDDVSLSLYENKSYAIIGSSGCGKSTLVKVLLKIIKPFSGSFSVNGNVGFVSQDPYSSIQSNMKVKSIVAEPLIFNHQCKTYASAESYVKKALESVHLDYDTYKNRLACQLSGGERQRVGIARAISFHPKILIMDEPTSMLDEAVKGEIAAIIKDIIKIEKVCFLMVTHDIALSANLCDYIFVMSDGKIIEEGESDMILTSPKQQLTEHLVLISKDIKEYWKQHFDV